LLKRPAPAFLLRNSAASQDWSLQLKAHLAAENVSLPLVLLGGLGGSGSRGFAKVLGELPSVHLAYNTQPELDFVLGGGLFATKRRLERAENGNVCDVATITDADLRRGAFALAAAAATAPPRRRYYLALKHGSHLCDAAVYAKLLGPSGVVFVHYVRDGRAMAASRNLNQLHAYGAALGIDAALPLQHQQALLWARLNVMAANCVPKLLGGESGYVRVRYDDFAGHSDGGPPHASNSVHDLEAFLARHLSMPKGALVKAVKLAFTRPSASSTPPIVLQRREMMEEFKAAQCLMDDAMCSQ
jgi:hypothetical protein